jgi:hypothetical protein
MEEIEKDVIVESSTTTQDVNQSTEVVQAPTEAELASGTSTPETIAGQAREHEVDEKGVSYKNRYEEMRRKHEQLSDSLPQMIEQTLQQNLSKIQTQQKQQPQEYSIEQIENFVAENPQYKAWGEQEKGKLIAKQAVDELEKRMNIKEQRQAYESKRQLAEAQVKAEFPDIWTKDSYGRDVLDPQNPVVRELAGIMQDPDLQRRADGLLVATEIAYSRMARRGQINTVKKEAKLKAEVKKLEKKTFTEGGQKSQVVAKDELRDSIEALKKTGSKQAGLAAVSAYFKKAGYIQ